MASSSSFGPYLNELNYQEILCPFKSLFYLCSIYQNSEISPSYLEFNNTIVVLKNPGLKGISTVGKILIVDDCLDIRELMAFVFEPEGYKVITATNGVEALEKFTSESHPDLIFLDHDMEGMDGPKFISELKRIYPGSVIPIIMLTGRELNTVEHSIVTQAFKKPLSVEFLLSLATTYIRQV